LPVTVARILEVPINWVYEVADPVEGKEQEENSPFATINS